MDLIAKEKPDVICIEETMLSKQTNFNLKNYNELFKEGNANHQAHGGVAIFIHYTIPYQKLILNTPLQAIAARINIGRDMTIVSIYNSQSHDTSENLLSTLFQQLPKPVALKRDFNSFHQIWRRPANDKRKCQVSNFINKNQLNILKDGRHTRASGISKSAFHLTIVSPFYSTTYPGMSQTVL